jgi:hypothetical protein
MLYSAPQPLTRGDVVCSNGRHGLVWSVWPNVVRLFPIVAAELREHDQSGDVAMSNWADMARAGIAGSDLVIRAGMPMNVRRRLQVLTGWVTGALLSEVALWFARNVVTARIEESNPDRRPGERSRLASPLGDRYRMGVGNVASVIKIATPPRSSAVWNYDGDIARPSAPVPATLRAPATTPTEPVMPD